MSTFFNRFDKSWATSGIVIDPTDAQANAGFAYLGPVPPSVEGFNAMFQWNDDKDNWLFNQITNVIESVGGPVTATDLDALLHAINSKIAANNPAGIYLPLTGGTLAGPGNLIVSGPLEARGGRILSTGTAPSIALTITGATPFSAGIWPSGSSIKIGVTNTSGLPTTEWGTFAAGSLTYTGSINTASDVNVGQTLRIGSSGFFYVSDDVTARTINFASGYFNKYTVSSGQRSWNYPGGAMTLTNAGVLTVASHQKVGGWGINYYPVDATNYIGFGWDGTNANFYVNGTWQSALAFTGRFVAKAGDTMTGDLRAPHFIASTFVEGPIIQTPGVAAFMQGDTMRANTFVTAAAQPYAYMQGAGIYAHDRIDCGGVIYAGGDVNAGGSLVGDFKMHADANATYLNFQSSHYFNWERSTGNLLYWVAPGTAWHKWTAGGSLEMALDQAWKPGTNTWGVISDDRVKKEHFAFRKGLNEVIALRPIVFSYTDEHGFDGTLDPKLATLRDEDNVPDPTPFNNLKTQIESQQRYVGLSAQETEKIFPEMISKRVAQFNGQVVTDFRGINNNELQYAFINAFKEINQRLIILEGEPK